VSVPIARPPTAGPERRRAYGQSEAPPAAVEGDRDNGRYEREEPTERYDPRQREDFQDPRRSRPDPYNAQDYRYGR
jgi:hypothetical protein